jgi:hypothetical protein
MDACSASRAFSVPFPGRRGRRPAQYDWQSSSAIPRSEALCWCQVLQWLISGPSRLLAVCRTSVRATQRFLMFHSVHLIPHSFSTHYSRCSIANDLYFLYNYLPRVSSLQSLEMSFTQNPAKCRINRTTTSPHHHNHQYSTLFPSTLLALRKPLILTNNFSSRLHSRRC